jgi:hypothetical protein
MGAMMEGKGIVNLRARRRLLQSPHAKPGSVRSSAHDTGRHRGDAALTERLQEALHVLLGLEPLQAALPSPRGLMGVLGPVIQSLLIHPMLLPHFLKLTMPCDHLRGQGTA